MVPGVFSNKQKFVDMLRQENKQLQNDIEGARIAEFIRNITMNPDDWVKIITAAEDNLFEYDEEAEYEDDEWDDDEMYEDE
jgi:hypothetical protein